jgi:hypothetical protein
VKTHTCVLNQLGSQRARCLHSPEQCPDLVGGERVPLNSWCLAFITAPYMPRDVSCVCTLSYAQPTHILHSHNHASTWEVTLTVFDLVNANLQSVAHTTKLGAPPQIKYAECEYEVVSHISTQGHTQLSNLDLAANSEVEDPTSKV